MSDTELIDAVLNRGVINIIPSKEKLKKLLRSDKKLNIYLGIEPTFTKIHIGNAVPLRKLGMLAQMGHNVTFLIGDFTALIGDTSDKDTERPVLTSKEINKNFQSYKKQAEKIIDFENIRVVHNSQWLSKLNFEETIKLVRNFSVGDFVGRDLIKKRLKAGTRVRLDETLYPVMQGYDSYYMDTDIQIGGADQTFNMQAGRRLQKKLRKKESFVLVTDYIMGTDGKKMSKSLGNAIWIEDDPNEMFGKAMSLNDSLIGSYLELATNLDSDDVSKIMKLAKSDPKKAKLLLAEQIVKEIHGSNYATEARNKFEKTFSNKDPGYEDSVDYAETLLDVVVQKVDSKTQAKRLIADGAVSVDGNVVKNPTHKIHGGEKIKIGKKLFVLVKNKT